MAKHNVAILNGQVLSEPKVFKDPSTGDFVRAIGSIVIIRGVRDFGKNIDHIKYDAPIIMSSDPDMVKIMATWSKGDMVEVKGTVTTKDIVKSTTCAHCGHKNKKLGNVVYINPIYICVHEQKLSSKEGHEILKERCEMSNQVTLIGPVCREPRVFRTDKGLLITTYQLAVRRKYRIKSDSAEIKTDFPWVKSYGNIAINDAKTIKKGTYLFVDGMIQTRELKRVQKCEECGEEYEWKDSAMEIVPYATEYLRDYYTKEEIAQKESDEGALAAEDVLNEKEIDAGRPEGPPVFEEDGDGEESSASILND